MGKGTYSNGIFDLYLAFCKKAVKKQGACLAKFQEASGLLYQATKQQMQFGKLNILSCNSSEADIYIYDGPGLCYSYVCGIREDKVWMTLFTDEILSPQGAWAILHEFGHYALCLYDEYRDALGNQPAHCADPGITHHCVMEFSSRLDVSDFCTAQTHNTMASNLINWQESANKQSCWDHLSKNYCLGYQIPPNLSYADMPLCQSHPEYVFNNPHPIYLEPRQAGPLRYEYADPVIIEVPLESRFALLLDRSGSMTPSAMDGIRFGAHFWATYLFQSGAKLALIFYNQAQQVLSPLDILSDHQLSYILEALPTITPEGQTNLAGVLETGLKQLTAPGYPASTQELILVTDGVHNTGKPPAEWPSDLVNRLAVEGIRLQALGLGVHDDQAFLQRVTAGAGGRFCQLGEDVQGSEAQLAIQEAFIHLAGELRDGFGPVLMERGRFQEPSAAGLKLAATVRRLGNYTLDALDLVRRDLLDLKHPDIVCRYRVYLEEGVQQAAFMVSYLESDAVNVYLFRPGGEPVNPEGDAEVRFRQPHDAPYAFYVINAPAPGDWTLLVVRRQAEGEIPFSVMASSENPELAVAVDVNRQLFEPDREITLKAMAYYQGLPLTDLENPVALVGKEDVYSGAPEYEEIILQPQMTFFDAEGKPLEKPVPMSDGIFRGVVRRSQPGSYSVKVQFRHTGNQAPRFQRLKRLQIHVGPLSPGEDIEGGGLKGKIVPTGGIELKATIKRPHF
jgi:hypothetical protein